MKSYYYYLISSLPMLQFGMKSPIAYSDFLECCETQLTGHDMDIIKRALITPPETKEDKSPALREWKEFDTLLRNELTRSRAAKRAKDPLHYIRGEDTHDPFIAQFSHWAIGQESLLEAELYLDRARWEKIDELSKGHYFDIDFLIAYSLKLQILERWNNINSGSPTQALQELLAMEHI